MGNHHHMSQEKAIFGWRTLDRGVILTITLQIFALVYWASSLNAQVEQHSKDIAELKTDVNAVNTDIREILLGIEQVKARLGIVESGGGR